MPPTPKNPAGLSESLFCRLNSYALAASAAGVGFLALAQPAEAKIVYHRIHYVIPPWSVYHLRLGQSQATDFNIFYQAFFSVLHLNVVGVSGNSVAATTTNHATPATTYWFALALRRNTRVSSEEEKFLSGGAMATLIRDFGRTFGQWINVTDRYLGLKFQIKGATHYGWARLNARVLRKRFKIIPTLTGYAYETIPNKPIITGKTKGRDVITLEPGSLGRLAQGSAGRSGK